MDLRTYLIIKLSITVLVIASAAVLCLMISYNKSVTRNGHRHRPRPSERPLPERPLPERPLPERPLPERPLPERPSPEKPQPEEPSVITCDFCRANCTCDSTNQVCEDPKCFKKHACSCLTGNECLCRPGFGCGRRNCHRSTCTTCKPCKCIRGWSCDDEKCAPAPPCSCTPICDCTKSNHGSCPFMNCTFSEACVCPKENCKCEKGKYGCGRKLCPVGTCSTCEPCLCKRTSLNKSKCLDEDCAPVPACTCRPICTCFPEKEYCESEKCAFVDCEYCNRPPVNQQLICSINRRKKYTCNELLCYNRVRQCDTCERCMCDRLASGCGDKKCDFASPCRKCETCNCDSSKTCKDRNTCPHVRCSCAEDCICEKTDPTETNHNKACDDLGCKKRPCICVAKQKRCGCSRIIVFERCKDQSCPYVMIVHSNDEDFVFDNRTLKLELDSNCNCLFCGLSLKLRSDLTVSFVQMVYRELMQDCRKENNNQSSNTVEAKRIFLKYFYDMNTELAHWYLWTFQKTFKRIMYDGDITLDCFANNLLRLYNTATNNSMNSGLKLRHIKPFTPEWYAD